MFNIFQNSRFIGIKNIIFLIFQAFFWTHSFKKLNPQEWDRDNLQITQNDKVKISPSTKEITFKFCPNFLKQIGEF